jgi:diguanylate cyclase (GGDEF)-like protein
MRTDRAFFRSLGDLHTYDPRRNLHLWFGFLWGLPIPVFFLLLTGGGVGPGVSDLVHNPWVRAFFLAHPLLFAVLFGALGAMRRDLEKENARLIEQLKGEAWTDPLTGLYNRRYVMEEFRNILRRALRSRDPVRAALFDLDGFKAVNDRQGHLAGDVILRKAAEALRVSIRQGDLLGRFGGDEFLLVTLGDAATLGEIVARCSEAVFRATGLTISAGVTEVAAPGEGPEALIERADVDLAEAKKWRYETKGIARRNPET